MTKQRTLSIFFLLLILAGIASIGGNCWFANQSVKGTTSGSPQTDRTLIGETTLPSSDRLVRKSRPTIEDNLPTGSSMVHTASGRVRISIPGKGFYDAAKASVTSRGIVLIGPVGFAINEEGPFIGAVDLNSVLYIDRRGVTKIGGDSTLIRETTSNEEAEQGVPPNDR